MQEKGSESFVDSLPCLLEGLVKLWFLAQQGYLAISAYFVHIPVHTVEESFAPHTEDAQEMTFSQPVMEMLLNKNVNVSKKSRCFLAECYVTLC
jgi:hypothetical protein